MRDNSSLFLIEKDKVSIRLCMNFRFAITFLSLKLKAKIRCSGCKDNLAQNVLELETTFCYTESVRF